VKWFLDRDVMAIYLVFSEPVAMKTCAGISLHTVALNVSFGSCSAMYDDFGTKLIIDLTLAINGSVATTMATLKATTPSGLFMSLSEGSFDDLAAIPNSLASEHMIVETGPGGLLIQFWSSMTYNNNDT
jgi:hypothetical protein